MGIESQFGLSSKLGFTIGISGEFNLDRSSLESLSQTYLPGATLIYPVPNPSLTIEHCESNDRHLEISNNKVKIYDIWDHKLSPDIWHLIYSIWRVELLKLGYCTVHASCVGKDQQILLVGHTGVGKSTILLKMVEEYGWQVFSGNKTVVSHDTDGMTAIAGNQSISLRSSGTNNRNSFFLEPKYLAPNASYPIKAIYLVSLNDGVSENLKLNFPSNLHMLYPYFLDVVNANTIMCNGNDVFLGTPPAGSEISLVKKMSQVVPKIATHKITGSLEFVTSSIAKEL